MILVPSIVRAVDVTEDVYGTPTEGTDLINMTVGYRKFKLNGVEGTLDTAPQIKWSRTFLPIQPIITALKGTISWNAKTQTATIKRGTTTIVLTIGNHYATVNGKKVAIDSDAKVVPYLLNGRTMLPLRFICETLGGVVKWYAETRRITIAFVRP
jgi:hypothetical protein